MIREAGHMIREAGHMIREAGHMIRETGHMVREAGHMIREARFDDGDSLIKAHKHSATQSSKSTNTTEHAISRQRECCLYRII